jgi:hypothetical protein
MTTLKSTEAHKATPLGELLPRFDSIQIFAGLVRDVSTASALLSIEHKKPNEPFVFVLAPSNSALQALPQKPWENKSDYEAHGASAYSGDVGSQRADDNLRQFVERHLVTLGPGNHAWAAGEHGKRKTTAGTDIWYESHGEAKTIQPGGTKVVKELERSGNGVIWEIEGVLGA